MSIESDFRQADQERTPVLNRARKCASLVIPTILPEANIGEDQDIVWPFQGLGAQAVSNLVSKMLQAVFSNLWFRYKPAAAFSAAGQASKEMLQAFKNYLLARELQINSYMNSTKYRPRMRTLLEHVIVVGNALGHVLSDGHIAIYRFDNFVFRRNAGGKLLSHITREHERIEEFTEEDLAKADVKREDIERKPESERYLTRYTRAFRKQSADKTWFIEQEVNEHIIRGPSEEPVTPYLAVGYIENVGDNYSRSRVEELLGALASYNGLYEAFIDFAAAAANIWPVVDPSDPFLRPAHLTKTRGKILQARVVNGLVQHAGHIKMDNYPDFRVVFEAIKHIEESLGKQFLLETEAQPTGERVTATQVMRVARQLEGALGAVYSEIAEELQRPYLDRIVYQMERDNKLVGIPKKYSDLYEIQVLTGMEALDRQVEVESVVGALQILAPIRGALDKIDLDSLVELVFRGFGVDLAELLKSDEQMQAEREAQQAEMMRAAAGQQAVSTAGKMMEMAAAQPAPTA